MTSSYQIRRRRPKTSKRSPMARCYTQRPVDENTGVVTILDHA